MNLISKIQGLKTAIAYSPAIAGLILIGMKPTLGIFLTLVGTAVVARKICHSIFKCDNADIELRDPNEILFFSSYIMKKDKAALIKPVPLKPGTPILTAARRRSSRELAEEFAWSPRTPESLKAKFKL